MPKNRHHIFLIFLLSALAAAVVWVADSAVDSLVFKQGTFLDLLIFRVPSFEMYLRALSIILIVTSGIVWSRIASKRNLARDAQKESEAMLGTITGAAKDAIIMMDHEGRITFWNPAAEEVFGYTAEEARGRELHGMLAPARNYDTYRDGFVRFRESGEGPRIGRTLELTAVRKGGEEIVVELSLSSLRLKGGWNAVGVLRDITERKKAEEELRSHREQLERLVGARTEALNEANELLRKEIGDRARTEEELSRSENFLHAIFDSFHDPFSIVDRDFRIVKFNDAYARMRGMRASDLAGKKCHEILRGSDCVCRECIVESTFQSKDPCAKEKLITLPDGTEAWFEIYTYPIQDRTGAVTHVVEYARDITQRKKEDEEKKQLIQRLNFLSTTDVLTGMLNRRALNDTLVHEIERAIRYDTDLSLILCDVDRFKEINDTFGHMAGDSALRTVAEALKKSLRKSDIVGRYGGDEFMIILPETPLSGAQNLAEKVRAAVNELDLGLPGNRSMRLSLSLGVTSCCAPLENIDTLVSLADSALYESKQAGRNRVSTRGM